MFIESEEFEDDLQDDHSNLSSDPRIKIEFGEKEEKNEEKNSSRTSLNFTKSGAFSLPYENLGEFELKECHPRLAVEIFNLEGVQEGMGSLYGDIRTAKDMLKKSGEKYPSTFSTETIWKAFEHAYKGLTLKGDEEKIRYARESLKMSSGVCNVAYNVLALYEAKNYKESIRYFQKCIEVSMNGMCSTNNEQELKEDGNAHLILPLRPFILAYIGLIKCYRGLKEYEKALECLMMLETKFQRKHLSYSTYFNYRYMIPEILIRCGKYEECVEYIEKHTIIFGHQSFQCCWSWNNLLAIYSHSNIDLDDFTFCFPKEDIACYSPDILEKMSSSFDWCLSVCIFQFPLVMYYLTGKYKLPDIPYPLSFQCDTESFSNSTHVCCAIYASMMKDLWDGPKFRKLRDYVEGRINFFLFCCFFDHNAEKRSKHLAQVGISMKEDPAYLFKLENVKKFVETHEIPKDAKTKKLFLQLIVISIFRSDPHPDYHHSTTFERDYTALDLYKYLLKKGFCTNFDSEEMAKHFPLVLKDSTFFTQENLFGFGIAKPAFRETLLGELCWDYGDPELISFLMLDIRLLMYHFLEILVAHGHYKAIVSIIRKFGIKYDHEKAIQVEDHEYNFKLTIIEAIVRQFVYGRTIPGIDIIQCFVNSDDGTKCRACARYIKRGYSEEYAFSSSHPSDPSSYEKCAKLIKDELKVDCEELKTLLRNIIVFSSHPEKKCTYTLGMLDEVYGLPLGSLESIRPYAQTQMLEIGRINRERRLRKVDKPSETSGEKKKPENFDFSTLVHQGLKQVHADMGISNEAMSLMNSLLTYIFEIIANESAYICRVNNSKTMSSLEAHVAVRLLIPGDLVDRGRLAVKKYIQIQKKEKEDQEERKKREERTCGKCFSNQKKLKKCARCKKVYYCSVKCQKSDWKEHKANCVIIVD